MSGLSHVYPLGSRVNERGHLEVGGCDVVELAREFDTPAYVVCEADIRARARAFTSAFAARCDDFEVHFASKAFPCTAVLRILREEGLACDVASGGELAIALKAGFDPARIHLHGNAKSERELAEALAAGVGHVVVDNDTDIDRLEQMVPAGIVQRVQLRVAPGVSPDTHPAISTGGPNTKFGFGLHDAAAAIERLDASERLDLEGLHLHIGSQIYDVESFRTALEAMASLATHGMVNLGGGLGVAYVGAEHPPAIEDYVAAKVDAVRDVMGADVRILDEPGRALVANSTVTLYTIESIKRNVDLYVAVDGGMSDNAPDALRRPLRGPGRLAAGRRHLLPPGRQALRVRRPHRPRRRAGRPARRRRRRHRRHRRLRLRDGQHLQRHPARAGGHRRRRRRPPRRAPRDLRRAHRARRPLSPAVRMA